MSYSPFNLRLPISVGMPGEALHAFRTPPFIADPQQTMAAQQGVVRDTSIPEELRRFLGLSETPTPQFDGTIPEIAASEQSNVLNRIPIPPDPRFPGRAEAESEFDLSGELMRPPPIDHDDYQDLLRREIQGRLSGYGGSSSFNGAPVPRGINDRVGMIQQMLQPGEHEQSYLNMTREASKPVHGLKSHLAGLGKGFLMGGFPGMFRGLADPTTANIQWKQGQLQQLGQAAQAENAMRQNILNRAAGVANLTGIDPMTGLETPGARYKDIQGLGVLGRLDQARINQENLKDYRWKQLNLGQRRAQIQAFNAAMNAYEATGTRLTPEMTQALSDQYGIMLPRGMDFTKYDLEVNYNGDIVPIAKSGPGVGKTPEGAGVKSYDVKKTEEQRYRTETIADAMQKRLQLDTKRASIYESEADRRADESALKQAEQELGKPPASYRPPEEKDAYQRRLRQRTDEIKARMKSSNQTETFKERRKYKNGETWDVYTTPEGKESYRRVP